MSEEKKQFEFLKTMWVPENMIFESSSEALKAGFGAAVLLADHLAYEELKAELDSLKSEKGIANPYLVKDRIIKEQHSEIAQLKQDLKTITEAVAFYIAGHEINGAMMLPEKLHPLDKNIMFQRLKESLSKIETKV